MEEIPEFLPERRKGEQPSRVGRGPSKIIGAVGALHKQLTRQGLTPGELAGWKLNQELEKYPEFTKENREDLQNEFTDMPGIRTMNMKVLAAVLAFLKAINNKVTPNMFSDTIIRPYLSRLLPIDVSRQKLNRLKLRYKAQFLIYIRAIELFRSE